jgi:hypothetical protein
MKTLRLFIWACMLGSAGFVLNPACHAATNSWTGATGDWFDTNKWSLLACPANGDDVYITNANARVIVSNATAQLSTLTLSRTLVFTNWDSIVNATNITIVAGGTATVANAFTDTQVSNNVYFSCSNFTLAWGGVIDVNLKGYAAITGGQARAAGYGPTPGQIRAGAGHGGSGGVWSGSGPGGQCDATNAPVQPGSSGAMENSSVPTGAGNSGAGGGAVRIAASGAVTVHGTIGANAGNASGYSGNSGGAGGSVWITCSTLSSTSGLISANGGAHAGAGGGGGGGRIAIICSPSEQSALAKPNLQLSANYGSGSGPGGLGSLYVSDNQLLPELGTALNGEVFNVFSWSPDRLTLSNSWVRFMEDGFRLTITNDLILTNSSAARLELTNATVEVRGNVGVYGGRLYLWGGATNFVSIVSSNNLLMTNGAAVYIYSGTTNAANTNLGGRINVAGSFTIATNCTLFPYSHPTNGGSVFITVSNLSVYGRIDADAKGFAGRIGAAGLGDGAGGINRGGGGGYGGRGGNTSGGSTYGDSNAPVQCGSSGGAENSTINAANIGGAGGGLIWVQADNTILIDGTLSASGGVSGGWSGCGGGAGGGIYLRAKTIAGSGWLLANGSPSGSSNAGGGGGGRIALVYSSSVSYNGVLSAAGAIGNPNPGNNGATGTVVQLLAGSAYLFTVHGSPVEPAGSCTYGVTAIAGGTITTNAVITPAGEANNQRWVCIGYTLTNTTGLVDSGSSTQVVFTMTTNLFLTWLWTNQYYLTATANTNGGLTTPVAGWYTNGTVVSAGAVASNGFYFLQWSGNGVPAGHHGDSPLSVTMDRARDIQANFASDTPTNREWTGSGYWFNPGNWSPPGIPGPSDLIAIRSGTNVIGDPVSVQSLIVSNNAALVFSNWQAKLTTTDSVLIRSNATVGLAAAFTDSQMSNRIWIACADLTLDSGATVSANEKGYAAVSGTGTRPSGYGPGAGGLRGGAGHGGAGGNTTGGGVYDVSNAPALPGSSGGPEKLDPGVIGLSGAGGGAIRVDASGTLTLNGAVTANGGAGTGWGGNSGGSGGSIYLTCGRLKGSGVSLSAAGGKESGNGSSGGGGGGGRIAVIMYGNQTSGTVVTNVAGGYGGMGSGGTGTVVWQTLAPPGSSFLFR